MISSNVDHLIKHTFLYSYIISQPFSVYVDAYPIIENKILLETSSLEYGEHNEAVRILQKKLKSLQFYNDEIDGHYNILTEYALKKFQEEHGIVVSGVANQETIELVLKAELDKQLEVLEKLPDEIDPDNDREHIKVVQGILYYFGYYNGEIDGLYGPLTKRAVKIADKRHDLNLAEKLTKRSLQQIVSESKEAITPPIKEVKKEVKNIKVINKHTNIIQQAKTLLGSPYHWGGTSPRGFDCSGFIYYLYKNINMTVPRSVTDLWNFSTPVNKPSVGDLVFFQTYKAGPSHVGIYLGNNQFIHAGVTKGVSIANINDQYWRTRYLGAKRIQ